MVDKQIAYGPSSVADYWIRDFLLSDFLMTGPAGTRRLAKAIREAIRSESELPVKHELSLLASLLPGLGGKLVSVNTVFERYAVTDSARRAVAQRFSGDALLDAVFAFDADEFRNNAAMRAVELDNQGILLAPAESFDDVFSQEAVTGQPGAVRFSSEGRIVDESIRQRRSGDRNRTRA